MNYRHIAPTFVREALGFAVAALNTERRIWVGDTKKGPAIVTNDGGLWVGGKLLSHPMLGPALAQRNARERQSGGA